MSGNDDTETAAPNLSSSSMLFTLLITSKLTPEVCFNLTSEEDTDPALRHIYRGAYMRMEVNS